MNEEFCKGTQFGKRIAHGGIPQALVAASTGNEASRFRNGCP